MQFADGTSLKRAHFLAHKLQDAIVKSLPGTTVLIHLEPEDRVRPDRFGDPEPVSSTGEHT
jgi:divalent metal cation (Fe/Co/Zn/Cd) transporter